MPKPSVVINDDCHKVSINGKEVHLPRKQYEILRLFLKSNGTVLNRKEISKAIGISSGYAGDGRVIDQYIARLRKAGVENIKTLNHYGYRYVEER